MMILPLADALQNCLQNLTSRIAGLDNEQMTGRVMGMGAMLGFGVGAIKEQFKVPTSNSQNNSTNNNINTNTGGGLRGFVTRARSIISPTINLSAEKDYNGNINPVRDVISNNSIFNNTSKTNMENSYNNKSENKITPKSITKTAIKAGYTATKAYLKTGANLVEGNYDSSNYMYKRNNNKNSKRNKYQDTEYINRIANSKQEQKLGDNNEFKDSNNKS